MANPLFKAKMSDLKLVGGQLVYLDDSPLKGINGQVLQTIINYGLDQGGGSPSSACAIEKSPIDSDYVLHAWPTHTPERFELNVYPRTVGVVDDVYYDSYMMIPANATLPNMFDFGGPFSEYGNDWLMCDTVWDNWGNGDYIHAICKTGQSNTPSWNAGSAQGTTFPLGYYTHVKGYLHRAAAPNGIFKLWFDNALIINASGSGIETKRTMDDFYTTIFKVYANCTFPIYLKSFEIWDGIPAIPSGHKLTINPSTGGTTNPAQGTYTFP